MTTLVRWNPNRSIRRMHTDIDRLMESFFETPRATPSKNWGLALDVVETDNEYAVSAVVAGLKRDDIEITIEEGVLAISGEFINEFEKTDDNEDDNSVRYHLRERRYGSFSRKLRLPKDVDVEAISAKQEDGILNITLPKSEAAQPKKITVS
ncbi:MAG: Hsp20/alpha crystallin family protein [Chloroflexota bacterium]